MSKGKSYTVAQFADAIPGSGGIMSTIAKRVGCDWSTADKWCKASPTLARILQDERESILDLAESVLFKNIRDGDTSDAKWLLARTGKRRGYADKQEIEHSGQVVVVNWDDYGEADDGTSTD